MRNEFIRILTQLAQVDKNLILVTGDLGFGVFNDFSERFPKQYLNVGIAEQNMTGIATGMALEGKTVFTYSIGNFPTLRCLEQIRNDACYHHANVKIVTVGGGLCYGSLGISHHATEDLAIMRAIPHLIVVAPGDKIEASLATQAVYETAGTCYLRLGRANEPQVYKDSPKFEIGKAICVKRDGDIALISTGGILDNVLKTSQTLEKENIHTSVYSFHSLHPFDNQTFESIAKTSKLMVTIEEHSVRGGLGGVVAETLSEMDLIKKPLLLRLGIQSEFTSVVGDQEYLREHYGLSVNRMCDIIKKRLTSHFFH